jgi:quinol monooxygenase YgiN
MIVEYTRYRVPKDRREAFVEVYEQATGYLAASPHCLAYELTHCVEERDRFILRIEWGSAEEHLEDFRKQPGFQQFFHLVQPFLQQIEEMQHYELTRVVYWR